MIRLVRIRGFKRFREVEFRLPGHVVLAGPNNTGKTTLLQAIASWVLALRRWRELHDFNRRNGYRRVPIARQAFASVPLGSFDLLWTDRRYHGQMEIELRHDAGWAVTMLARWHDEFPPAVTRDPLGDHEFLNVTKARTRLIEPLLEAAGIYGLPYTRYHEIATLMRREEIHPEVLEKLNSICRAFGVQP